MAPGSVPKILRGFPAARVARLAPYFLLGPITGPFLAGVVINLREGRPVLASLYAIALAEWFLLAPLATAILLPLAAARLV